MTNSIGARNELVNGFTSLFLKAAKPNRSSINFYSNATTMPVSADSPVPASSVLLSQVYFASGAFLPAASGTAIASGLPLQGNILVGGTVSWFRFVDGAASPSGISYGSVTFHGGSGDITFDNTAFSSGAVVSIGSLSISMPA